MIKFLLFLLLLPLLFTIRNFGKSGNTKIAYVGCLLFGLNVAYLFFV